jgi:hypothetical protein
MVEAELRVGGSSTFDYRRLPGERISLPGESTTSVSGIVGRQPQGNLFWGRSQRELAGVVLPPASPACGFEVAWAVPGSMAALIASLIALMVASTSLVGRGSSFLLTCKSRYCSVELKWRKNRFLLAKRHQAKHLEFCVL